MTVEPLRGERIVLTPCRHEATSRVTYSSNESGERRQRVRKWHDCVRWFVGACVLGTTLGCGTTRWTDTQRTLTEQWLISDAIDQAVGQIDFRVLKDKPVFLDAQYLDLLVVDKGYLVSSVRQVLLASGCLLQEDRTKATYVVELRAGGIGTDRHDILLGLPQMTIPMFYLTQGLPAQTPEIGLAKRTKQIGGAKIEVFAYNRLTGHPVWQSGLAQHSSLTKHTWVLGIGPFQRGTIRDGTRWAGEPLSIPFVGEQETDESAQEPPVVPVTHEAVWAEPLAREQDSAWLDGNPVHSQTSIFPTLKTLSGNASVGSAEGQPSVVPAVKLSTEQGMSVTSDADSSDTETSPDRQNISRRLATPSGE